MRNLTALILVLLLITLPGCKYFKGKKLFGKKKAHERELLQARQDSIRIADSLRKVEERLKAIEEARLDSIRLAEEKKALELKQMEGGRFDLVSAESYENFRQAVERLHYFQENIELGAWLYVLK
jgi:hypothetical protein